MKAKTISKRVLSVILCTVMLFSCWVFTAPQADAATAGAYSYSFRMYLVDNDNADCNDNDGVHVYINTKNINGANNDEKQIEVPGGGKASTWVGVIQDKKDSTESGTTSAGYFPISVTISIDFDSGGWRGCKFKWVLSIGGTAIYTSGTCEMGGGWLFGHEKKTSSWNIDSSKYPVATTTSVGGGSTSVNVPTNGTSTNYSSAFSAGTVKDQYGVNWHQDATLSSNKPNGTGFSSNKISVTSGCNRASDYTVTITATCGSASATKTCTIKTFDYIVDFVDHDGTNLKHQTGINYNGSATAPSSPSREPDDTNHYAFKSWSGTYTNLTSGAQTKTITATYTGTAHSGWTYSEISGNHSNHTKKCGSCTYSTTAAHTYGATTITFGTNGQTATASRTCSTNGCNHTQETELSIGSGITSDVKTAATCTAVGTTTYTATSPYGDGKTATKDVADIPATGHHLAVNPIMYKDAEGHYYKCKDCNAFIKSDLSEGKYAHTPKAAQEEDVVNPTCTQAGSYNSVVRCSECDWAISSTQQTIPALGHAWGDWDTTDATNHTRVCSRNSSHVDTGAHAFSNWSKNIPQDETLIEKMKPDYDPSAQCFRYCNVCYRIEYSDHNYVGSETTPATCEGTGVKTYTCSICNDSYTETIPAKGHDYEEKPYQPVDAHAGFAYFECSACHKLRQAAYNGSTYVPDENKPEYAPDALSSLVEAVESDPTNTSIVPASTFNNFTDQTIPIGGGNYYNYSERGSGLRLMRNEETGAVDYSFNTDLTTIQDMRFSGAATLPTGVSISVNPAYRDYSEEDLKDAHVDNCLVDFGYIYTQDDYMLDHGGFDALTIENTDKTEHPGTKFARMSVASNNAANGTYNPTADNWTGVTYHSGDNQLTFNLVIRIKAKNWSYFYSCRPYMRYMYHGHLYTVYDEVAFGPTYSCNMVYYVADDMVRAHDPLSDYAQRKIIDNYDYLPKGDLK